MRRGTGTGRADKERGRGEEGRDGTAREDGWHVARESKLNAGVGDACRGAREKIEREGRRG